MANEKWLIDGNVLMEQFDDSNFKGFVMKRLIEAQPTVDTVEVVHGRWEQKEDMVASYLEDYTKVFYECSVCRAPNGDETNFCPNCGAKMDGGTST